MRWRIRVTPAIAALTLYDHKVCLRAEFWRGLTQRHRILFPPILGFAFSPAIKIIKIAILAPRGIP